MNDTRRDDRAKLPAHLVGDGMLVPCFDGIERPYIALDAAASTAALPGVVERVADFLPWYSSIHRGAGYKSRVASAAYDDARAAALAFAGRSGRHDVAIICRNTTEAINHLAYRLRLDPTDVVLTTVVEHHANLLPWGRVAQRRYIECHPDGRFSVDEVRAELDKTPRPKLLTITGASNVTGWLPPVDEIIALAHDGGVPVLVDAAQLAAHRPLPLDADYVVWSGHKMYAPFGAGILLGPAATFADGDPFLAGGGAIDLVDLEDVVWTTPPEREEAGSPNVIGAVALHAAMSTLSTIGWPAIAAHETGLARQLREGLDRIGGVTLLGPGLDVPTLAVASFVVDGVPHALVAARLSAEFAIGVRHGCFCAHPYILRLLGISSVEVARYWEAVQHGDRSNVPGAVRASASLATSPDEIDALLAAVAAIASGGQPPVRYLQDHPSGDYWTEHDFATGAVRGTALAQSDPVATHRTGPLARSS
ncbi:MAG: aminotransferase class V-fold PLP-dependent enzyme [Candidatus Dormibacter sp.]